MKKFGIVLAATMLAALCFAVVGCGSTDYTKNFTGTYTLTEMNTNDGSGTITSQQLTAAGVDVTLQLKDDKSFTLTMGSTTMSGTWSAKDAKTITMDWAGATSNSNYIAANDGTLDGSTLKLSDDTGAYMNFTKK